MFNYKNKNINKTEHTDPLLRTLMICRYKLFIMFFFFLYLRGICKFVILVYRKLLLNLRFWTLEIKMYDLLLWLKRTNYKAILEKWMTLSTK